MLAGDLEDLRPKVDLSVSLLPQVKGVELFNELDLIQSGQFFDRIEMESEIVLWSPH